MTKFHSLCWLSVAVLCWLAQGQAEVNKKKLKFKVSGRNLLQKDNIGTSDPYYEVFYSTDDGKSKTKIGTSDTITDQTDPDWGNNVFEFDFDRSKNQYWYLHVYDSVHLREDPTVGRVWVNVADYVDKSEFVYSNLDKGGYLIIHSKDSSVDTGKPGSLQINNGNVDKMTLKFKVSAHHLQSKGDAGYIPGRSNPYVVVKYTDGINGTEHDLGRSTTASNTKNPDWSDVFTFHWNKAKDQRLHFAIYDDDRVLDDKLGQGWMEANDYVAHGQDFTILLPKKGSLTILNADSS